MLKLVKKPLEESFHDYKLFKGLNVSENVNQLLVTQVCPIAFWFLSKKFGFHKAGCMSYGLTTFTESGLKAAKKFTDRVQAKFGPWILTE